MLGSGRKLLRDAEEGKWYLDIGCGPDDAEFAAVVSALRPPAPSEEGREAPIPHTGAPTAGVRPHRSRHFHRGSWMVSGVALSGHPR